MPELALTGRTIAVAETRELDVFADMLERRGARVLRCPLVGIFDAPDPVPVLDWIRWFNRGSCDDLILLTGEGLRRLIACIDRHEPSLKEAFLTQLARVRKITRGPKPGRALRELGLKPDLPAVEPTTAGIIQTLREQDLSGHTVGVQLYGTDPNLPLMEFLKTTGATVRTVAPYVYADASQDAAVLQLIERMGSGEVDAIAFTSKAQVERLFHVAETSGRLEALKAALARTLVASVGPIVTQELAAHGITAGLMPEESFFLKPLTSSLAERLGPRSS